MYGLSVKFVNKINLCAVITSVLNQIRFLSNISSTNTCITITFSRILRQPLFFLFYALETFKTTANIALPLILMSKAMDKLSKTNFVYLKDSIGS